jgi:DNA-binding SARP family transcriptional activator
MVRLLLLGALEISGSGSSGDLAAVARRPGLVALLAYLALDGRPFCSRDLVQALFWPEHDHPHARHNLNQALYAIRSHLGAEAVLDRGAGQIGLGRGHVWCDAAAAVDLYRGDLLPGFYLRDNAAFEEWLERTRVQLRRTVARAAWEQAVVEQGAGSPLAAVARARRAAELASDEVMIRSIIRLLDRLGDRAAAVHVFNDFRRRLDADLGMEPSPETAAAIRTVRRRAAPHEPRDP